MSKLTIPALPIIPTRFLRRLNNGRKLLTSLTIMLLLTACAQQTQVHLYTKYAEPEQVAALSNALIAAKFDVSTNTLDIPNDIRQSSVLYSPLLKSREDLATVKTIAEQHGWQNLQETSLVSGNHWYTKNTMALFLLPEGEVGKQRIASRDLENTYHSRNCSEDVQIVFKPNGRYQLTLKSPNKNQQAFAKGKWRVTSLPYISLNSDNGIWWFYLTVSHEAAVDKLGKAQLTVLTPVEQYKEFPQCQFSHGVRV